MSLLLFVTATLFSSVAQADCKSKLPENLTYESVRARIEECSLRRIEEVLAALPDTHLANYTLMHRSRSLHGSSVENPRAILFGKDAKFVLTFNGDPLLQ